MRQQRQALRSDLRGRCPLDTFDNGFHRALRFVFLGGTLAVLAVLVVFAVLAVLVVFVVFVVFGGTVEKQFMGGR